MLAIAMAIAQELAVARARIDTLERLLEHKKILTRAEIATYEPTAAEAAERARWTEEYITRVLKVLNEEAEQTGAAPDAAPSSP